MALHELKIIVVDGGKQSVAQARSQLSEGSSSNNKNSEDKQNSPLYKMLNLSQEIKSKVREKTSPATFYALQAGVSIATQTAKQVANYYLSDIGRANGDSNYQAHVNRTLEVVGDVTGVVQGIYGGAASGSMFGPIGMAIGAIAGGISSGVGIGFKYAERERVYQHEMFKESTSQAYNLARANYSIWTGRVR